MIRLKGTAGVGGTILAKAVVIQKNTTSVAATPAGGSTQEIERLNAARAAYVADLDQLYEKSLREVDTQTAQVFRAYKAIVTDESFFAKVNDDIEQKGVSAVCVIKDHQEKTSKKIRAIDNPYLRERADDIENVCMELIRRLNYEKSVAEQLDGLDYPFVIVADNLSPEDTVRLDKQYLQGFATQGGGATSHVMILANSVGLAAVVGVNQLLEKVKTGDILCISGERCECIINPDESADHEIMGRQKYEASRTRLFAESLSKPAQTADGKHIKVNINVGDQESIEKINSEYCDGVGLFRTEFLFMGQNDYPDEDSQFEVYKKAAIKTNGKELIIRTLDIGGDKSLAYMKLPKENNPFLGYRAIRICLDRKDIFLTQLRAILRASVYSNVKIMFPMIVTVEELREARQMVEIAKNQLRQEHKQFNEKIQVGIMIETPAAVLLSDVLAKYSDFFSIGTNDLIQYTTATDRMNEMVHSLYDPCNISVLRGIHTVIQNAHQAGISVGMCGEAASDEHLIPLLLGMGLDEFSVAAAKFAATKYTILQCNMKTCGFLAENVIRCEDIASVKERLKALSVISK